MKYHIGEGTFPLIYVQLDNNETILTESGAMVYHNGEVTLKGRMNSSGKGGLGGVLKAVGRSVTSGEGFFITEATGHADGALLALAPQSLGQVKELEVGFNQWRVNDGAFVACENTVDYSMARQSVSKALFSGTGGLYVMETRGSGTMLVSGLGELIEIDLDGSKEFVIDNFHVVAWDANLTYRLEVASGLFGFKTGEGLVNRFTGVGKVIIQSRNIRHVLSPE